MPTPVIPKFVGQCISLGRSQAVFQRITRSDVSARLVVSGRLGAFVKEGICLSTTLWGSTGTVGSSTVGRERLSLRNSRRSTPAIIAE